MNGMELIAASRAEEAGYLALRDIAILAADCGVDYRIVGGQMVSLHAAAAGVTAPVLRVTLDADLGVEPVVAADPAIVKRLGELGYVRPEAANRFIRRDLDQRELIIDLLTPSYVSRLISNVTYGDMTVDGIPGLSLALALDGEVLDLGVQLMDRSRIEFKIIVPTVLAALCVKTLGWASRHAAKDAYDVWRLLQVFRQRVSRVHEWRCDGVEGDAAKILGSDFAKVNGLGVRAAANSALDQAQVRALALYALGAR